MMKNHDGQIINLALTILKNRLREPGTLLTSSIDVKKYLTLNLGQLQNEVFMVLFLDSQNCLIAAEEMFRGTIDGASVYP